jgi:hypothetical protein
VLKVYNQTSDTLTMHSTDSFSQTLGSSRGAYTKTVYVVGFVFVESSGGFNWYCQEEDAKNFLAQLRDRNWHIANGTCGEELDMTQVVPLRVPTDLHGQALTDYIDRNHDEDWNPAEGEGRLSWNAQ